MRINGIEIPTGKRRVGRYGIIGEQRPEGTYYTGGNPWYTGYSGNKGGGSSYSYSGTSSPTMTPEDRAAIQWAFEQSSKSFDQGQQRLTGGQFMGGTLGQGAQQRYLNPTGMDPAVLERMKSELAAMYSGARKDQLANAQARASSSGFGDSQGAQNLMQQIEAQNAQDLVGAITNVLFQNEQYKLQQSGQAVPLLTNAQGLEALMNQLSSAGYFNREFPIVPGMGEDMGGTGYKYLNERGEIIPRPGWSQSDWEAAMAERRRWMDSGGRAA